MICPIFGDLVLTSEAAGQGWMALDHQSESCLRLSISRGDDVPQAKNCDGAILCDGIQTACSTNGKASSLHWDPVDLSVGDKVVGVNVSDSRFPHCITSCCSGRSHNYLEQTFRRRERKDCFLALFTQHQWKSNECSSGSKPKDLVAP